jgi:hypothetical protein
MGHPINHSTHSGFNWPPSEAITAWSIRSFDRSLPFFRVSAAGDDPFEALAHGVGHCFTAVRRFNPPSRPLFLGPPVPSLFVGVGHNFTSALSFGSPRLFHFPAFRSIASSATGVCQNPDSFAQMGSAGIGRRYDSPFRIEPHLGQVSKNSSESPRSEHWAVFHFDSLGSNFANDPRHFDPEAASLAVEPVASSSGTDVLTGKPASHNVSNSSPSASFKGSNVIPNRECRKGAVVLPRDEDRLGVGIKLNGAYASIASQLACKDSSASAREKMKLIHYFLTCSIASRAARMGLGGQRIELVAGVVLTSLESTYPATKILVFSPDFRAVP